MKHKFCCDASRDMYLDYYTRQRGDGMMPVFVGAPYQRGHGLGSILSGLFSKIVPFFRTNGRRIVSNLLRTGVDVATDVLEKKRGFTDAVKERVPEGIKRTAQDIDWQSGSGIAKRRRRHRRDIFTKHVVRSRRVV